MERIKMFTATLLFTAILMVPAAHTLAEAPSQEHGGGETILVGRVAHVEGSVLRYVPEEGDWVRIVKDVPFGLEDKLRSGKDSRAEIILPNNTWVRMDGETHLQLISLQNNKTEVHMVHGGARFIDKGFDSVITVTTAFGRVTAPPQTSFDLYVSDASVEVIALKGSVHFTRDADQIETEVIEGSASLVADRYAVSAGKGYRDPDWEAWNLERDDLWAKRMRAGGKSAKHLPTRLRDHAYALEDYGVWERVYYDGAYGYLWRPIYVDAGWAPYTTGSWTLWYGDHVWIPCEPFGYVTHHYGSWVRIRGYWYWAPPVTSVSVHFAHPALRIGFAWYPGRVAWFHFGVNIGWIPLAHHEPYYCHRHWGPGAVVVKNVNVVNVNIRKYRNVSHAVVIKKDHLHATDNYRNIRVKNVDHRTIVNKYKPVLVVDQKRAGRDGGKKRYSFKSVSTGRTFYADVAKGIEHGPSVATGKREVKLDAAAGKKDKVKPDNTLKRERVKPLSTKRQVLPVPSAGGKYPEGRLGNKDTKTNRKSLPVSARAVRDDRQSKSTPGKPITGTNKGIARSKASASSRAQRQPASVRPPAEPGPRSHAPKQAEQRTLKRSKPQTIELQSRLARGQRVKEDAPRPKGREISRREIPVSSSHGNGKGENVQRRPGSQSRSFSGKDAPSRRRDF